MGTAAVDEACSLAWIPHRIDDLHAVSYGLPGEIDITWNVG
jgi:hypothetical protein